jgi:hypothetical protein
MRTALVIALLSSAAAFAQPKGNGASLGQAFDTQMGMIEQEILGLARKMPADKYNFAPATGTPPAGTFDGVRTFGQQVRHIATVLYDMSSGISGEKAPVSTDGPNENGPANMTSKDESVKYLEGAIAFARKAVRTVTAENAMQSGPMGSKLATAAFLGSHSYDHYGQMVVYARLNGVKPGPDAPPQGKGKGKGK